MLINLPTIEKQETEIYLSIIRKKKDIEDLLDLLVKDRSPGRSKRQQNIQTKKIEREAIYK